MPTARASAANAKAPPAPKLSGPARAMRKLGLVRDIDLALHLPMRYVDETRLAAINSLRDGDTAQVQGVVQECRVETRSRRQLLVRLADDGGELLLRLLHFYPSHQKTLAVGQTVRVRGEVRAGFLGREMVHPEFRAVSADTPLPQVLTPVYPASAQLPQAYLRKAVVSALARAPLHELLPPGTVPAGLPTLSEALQLLHHPPKDINTAALEDHAHPAWQRLKFDELLAQQLSQAQAHAARATLAAPVRSVALTVPFSRMSWPSKWLRRSRYGVETAWTNASSPDRSAAPTETDVNRLHELLGTVSESVSELQQQHRNSLEEMQQVSVELSVSAASWLTGVAIDAGQFAVDDLIRMALHRLGADQPVQVRLNPADHQLLRELMSASPVKEQLEQMNCMDDPSLPRGSCRVDSGRRMLVSDMESRLEEIRKLWMENLDAAQIERRGDGSHGRTLRRFPDRRETA